MRVRLPVRLFASYAVVAFVGALAAYVTVRVLAPRIFSQRMSMMDGLGLEAGNGAQSMMGAGTGDGMGVTPVQDAFMSSLNIALVVGVLVGLIMAGMVAALVTRRVLLPLKDVRAATRRIASGDYDAAVPVPSEPEMAALAADVNTLATALATTETRRTRLLGDVAHEMRTPLTTLDGYVEGMIDGVFEASPETLAALTEELRRLHRLSDDLSALSRAQERRLDLKVADCDLGEIARRAADRLQPQFADAGIALVVHTLIPLPVRADADRITQVVTNLLGNALVATPHGGTVTITSHRARDRGEVMVTDTGVGLAGEDAERIFERFYRAPGRIRRSPGSGVGLTISREIARAHAGDIGAWSPGPDRGSTFTLVLPLR